MDVSEGNIIHVEDITVITTLLSGVIETYFIKDHFNCCLLNHTLVAFDHLEGLEINEVLHSSFFF